MSLQSVAASAKRARAAIVEAPQAIAKRGMFALVRRDHRYNSLWSGAYAGWSGYTPAIVDAVDRDGIAKSVRLAHGSKLSRRDWAKITVDSAGKIADAQHVVSALVDAFGCAIEYKSQGDAIRAIKAAAGL